MITLIASIAGFITSFIPELIKYFKDINDKKHKLDVLEKQIKFNATSTNKMLCQLQCKIHH